MMGASTVLGERKLLCAVIEQAQDDLLWRGKPTFRRRGKKMGQVSDAYLGRVRLRKEAYAWLFLVKDGFPSMAEWVELEVDAAREEWRKKILRECIGMEVE